MHWLHWGSFFVGVVCAWSLPWVLFGALAGACRAHQEHRRRRIARAMMDPGVSPWILSSALAERLARRDAAAVEHLLQSLSPKGER
jgi:hypothetical protein